jgi:hypothetical protein
MVVHATEHEKAGIVRLRVPEMDEYHCCVLLPGLLWLLGILAIRKIHVDGGLRIGDEMF